MSPLGRVHGHFRRRLLMGGMASLLGGAVATATPPGHQPPPDRRKPAPVSPARPSPSESSPPPSSKKPSSIPPAPELPAVPQVADDGPLGRQQLIDLALQAHPDFWRFRGEVAYYTQAEAAAYDWKDPELRIGLTHEFDDDLTGPYNETRSIATSERGLFDTTDTTTTVESPLPSGDAGSTTTRTSSNQSTNRSREITTETVRRITPGKYEDRIDETVYEVERRRDVQKETRRGPGNEVRNQEADQYSRRRTLRTSREYRSHPNSVYGDDSFGVQARFFVPNPFLMKAKAARARAERDLADQRLRSEMRALVFDVGRRYDELQFWNVWHQSDTRIAALQRENLTLVEEQYKALAGAASPLLGNLFDPAEVPRARLEIIKANEEVFDSRRKIGEIKEELCLLTGLAEPGRIVLTNSLRLRKLDESRLDLPSLVELARAHRPDLGEMQARSGVEQARLREVKALRLPWFNDVRVGWSRQTSDGYRDQDEISALLTLNWPLFSWWQNKEHRQHEEAIANYDQAQHVLGQRIDQQVAFAVKAVRDAAAGLAAFAGQERELRKFAELNEADAVNAGDKGPRIRLASREALIKSERGRLQWILFYNQAVARLEQMIGLPIEEAFAPAK